MQPASATWTAAGLSRSGLFDESLRPIDVPGSGPIDQRERVNATQSVPMAVQSAGGTRASDSLEFAGDTAGGLLTSHDYQHSTTDTTPRSDRILVTGAAGEQCVVMSVPPLPKYLRPRGAAGLPGFSQTAAGGGIGRSRSGGHTLLPGRVMDTVLRHEVPLDQGTLQPEEVLQRVRSAAQRGTMLANVNSETNHAHKRRQTSHIARCMMQARNLQRLEPSNPRDLTGEYLLAGAWAQQGFHGAPYRPDFDAPSLIGKYSSIALSEQMALKPRGLNTRSGQQFDFQSKAHALSSPGASLIAASGGSMHTTGFDLSPRQLASMSTLDSAGEHSLNLISAVAHSTSRELSGAAQNAFARSPSAQNLLLSATSQADISDFEQHNPAALAETLTKPQLKAALDVPITQDGRTAAALLHQRGIKPGKHKRDILNAARQIGVFKAFVRAAARFTGPGMEHPFKSLKASLARSIRRDLASAEASHQPRRELVLSMDTESTQQKKLRRKLENPVEQRALRARRKLAGQSADAAALFSKVGPPQLDDGTPVMPGQHGHELVRPLEQLTMRVSVPHPHTALLPHQAPTPCRASIGNSGVPASAEASQQRKRTTAILDSRMDAEISIAGDRLRQARLQRGWHRPGSDLRVTRDRMAAPDTSADTFQPRDISLLSPKQSMQRAKQLGVSPRELRVDPHATGQGAGTSTLTPRSQMHAYQLFKR